MVYRPTQTTSKPPRPPKGGSSADKESRTMTRQEAIELLRELWNFLATPPEIDEAVNMAIETLEQEETSQNLTKPNKSDLISRQDAIDTVMGFMPSLTTPDGCGQFDREIFEAQAMFVDIGQALNKLPFAQPERKTGKWIVLDECSNEGVYCSECHKKVLKIDYSNTMKCKNFKFCPNCGADMRGDEE